MSLFKNAPWSPLITGATLYLFTRAPDSYRVPALRRLQELLSPNNISRFLTTVKWLFALGVVRSINSFFNELAYNNFQWRSTKKDWDWPNEIAVVTGASSGFGKLFTQDLTAKGIRVAALDLNDLPPDLKSNRRVVFFKCDVTSPESVNEVAEHIRKTMGHPSILINNAGIGKPKSILDTKPEFLKKIFDVNLLAHWYTLQAFLPHMIEVKKGHVVSIASMASFAGAPSIVDYCATKAGALSLYRGLNSELRAIHNAPEIKNSIVHPTWANTPLIEDNVKQMKKQGMRVIDPQKVSDAVVGQILSGRAGQIVIAPDGPLMYAMWCGPQWFSYMFMRIAERSGMLSMAQ